MADLGHGGSWRVWYAGSPATESRQREIAPDQDMPLVGYELVHGLCEEISRAKVGDISVFPALPEVSGSTPMSCGDAPGDDDVAETTANTR